MQTHHQWKHTAYLFRVQSRHITIKTLINVGDDYFDKDSLEVAFIRGEAFGIRDAFIKQFMENIARISRKKGY